MIYKIYFKLWFFYWLLTALDDFLVLRRRGFASSMLTKGLKTCVQVSFKGDAMPPYMIKAKMKAEVTKGMRSPSGYWKRV